MCSPFLFLWLTSYCEGCDVSQKAVCQKQKLVAFSFLVRCVQKAIWQVGVTARPVFPNSLPSFLVRNSWHTPLRLIDWLIFSTIYVTLRILYNEKMHCALRKRNGYWGKTAYLWHTILFWDSFRKRVETLITKTLVFCFMRFENCMFLFLQRSDDSSTSLFLNILTNIKCSTQINNLYENL